MVKFQWTIGMAEISSVDKQMVNGESGKDSSIILLNLKSVVYFEVLHQFLYGY